MNIIKEFFFYIYYWFFFVCKFAWVFPLEGNKYITVPNAFQKRSGKFRHKNYDCKTMVYKCIQNIMMENLLLLKYLLGPIRIKFTTNTLLQYQNILNINKLDYIIHEYNHRIIKMKPTDVKEIKHPDYEVENDEYRSYKNRVAMSKYKNIFAKFSTLKWSDELFVNRN